MLVFLYFSLRIWVCLSNRYICRNRLAYSLHIPHICLSSFWSLVHLHPSLESCLLECRNSETGSGFCWCIVLQGNGSEFADPESLKEVCLKYLARLKFNFCSWLLWYDDDDDMIWYDMIWYDMMIMILFFTRIAKATVPAACTGQHLAAHAFAASKFYRHHSAWVLVIMISQFLSGVKFGK